MSVIEFESKFHIGTTERTETVRLGEYIISVNSDKLYLHLFIYKDGKDCWSMLLSTIMAEILRSELVLARFDENYHHKIMLGKASFMDDSCFNIEIKRNDDNVQIIFTDVAYSPSEWRTEVTPYQLRDLIDALLNAICHKEQQKRKK